MAYSEDRKPSQLSTVTTLATDDTVIVGDTSDTSEVVKAITYDNLKTQLESQLNIGASNLDSLTDVTITGVTNGEVLQYNGSAWVNTVVAGTGDVTAASAFANDNRIIRSDGTGKGVQSSAITVDDTGNMSGVGTLNTHTIPGGTGTVALTSDLHSAVTVSGTPDYITLVGQDIVRGQIDLTTDVTGDLPFSNIAEIATNRILGRSTAGTGDIEALADSAARTIMGLATSDSPQFTGINLGHATDTTIARVSAGVISVEGVTVPTISSTNTLTNKRITKRTGSTTSSATPTINTDDVDEYYLTAQAADITSFTTNLSGTPTEGQTLFIAITGTAARAITWGASFENGPVALPTTTVTTTRLDVLFKWNSVTSKWRCMASGSTV
jgi:hypothetical protein